MPSERPEIDLRRVEAATQQGEATATAARMAREDLRWTAEPGSDEREAQIAAMIDDIGDAMHEIRSLIGRLTWDPIPDEYEKPLRSASRQLQYERKQLKKMRRRG